MNLFASTCKNNYEFYLNLPLTMFHTSMEYNFHSMVIKPLFQKNYKSLDEPYEYNARQRKDSAIDTPFLFKYVQ